MSTNSPPPPPPIAGAQSAAVELAPVGAKPPIVRVTPPRPGWLLIALAIPLFALAVFWVSLMPYALVEGNMFALMGTFGLTGAMLGCSWLQYVAIFRRNAKAAQLCSDALSFFTVLAILPLAMLVIATCFFYRRGMDVAPWIVPHVVLIAGLVYMRFATIENRRWSRTLWVAERVGFVAPTKSFTTRELLAGVAFVAAILGLSTAMLQGRPAQSGEHVDVSQAPARVPSAATDISYYRVRDNLTCEFTIDEASFVAWVKADLDHASARENGAQLLPIQGSTSIRCCSFLFGEFDGYVEANVTNGLQFQWSDRRNGGAHAVFDRKTNRAYFNYSPY